MRMFEPSWMLSQSDEALGREHDDGRAVLEPAHLLAFLERRIAGNDVRPAVLRSSSTSRKCSRMLATRMAATGTSVTA